MTSQCTFGVTSGRFLGHLVTRRGIEANPNQIKVIHNMKIPALYKEVQELTSRIAALYLALPICANPSLLCFEQKKKSAMGRRVHAGLRTAQRTFNSPTYTFCTLPRWNPVRLLGSFKTSSQCCTISRQSKSRKVYYYVSKALLEPKLQYTCTTRAAHPCRDPSPWEIRGTQLMVTRGTYYQPDHHHPDSPKDMHGAVILAGPPQGKANDAGRA